ncbi:hypothetical protein NW762_006652 [Fusarium torreyae]|uniref:Uncharacterized protein n=1 Tax=Fusarium torreyae TaxID=1237075 RepID=A0A9W8RZE7_9HYPO|nr:hypothetical protein NW762_006652 [Fusarium torreyae]
MSTKKIAVYSPAFLKSPTLVRFLPTFQPRRFRSIRLGGNMTNIEAYRLAMRNMYHDLGAMVFKGTDDSQTVEIGNLLAEVVKPQPRLQIHNMLQHAPTATAWVEFDKWNVYRIPVEEKHLDKSYYPERGFLSEKGLFDLGISAEKMWKDVSHKARKEVDLKVYENSTKIQLARDDESEGPGLINASFSSPMYIRFLADTRLKQTINGPRLPHLDAFVATGRDEQYITMHIEFHTVGTMRFVGSIERSFIIPDPPRDDSPAAEFTPKYIYDRTVPGSIKRTSILPARNKLLYRFWGLEQKIWNLSKEALRRRGRPPKRYFLSLPPGVKNPPDSVDIHETPLKKKALQEKERHKTTFKVTW